MGKGNGIVTERARGEEAEVKAGCDFGKKSPLQAWEQAGCLQRMWRLPNTQEGIEKMLSLPF